MNDPLLMCSAPSSSMIAVPDAVLLPITPRPVSLENSAMMPGGPRQDDAHHFPVAGDRILTRRHLRHPSDGSRGQLGRRRSTQRHHPIQPERAQRGHTKWHTLGDVAERVAAFVSVLSGVRQLADADTVEHDDDGSFEWPGIV
jgi:hypothetical protein